MRTFAGPVAALLLASVAGAAFAQSPVSSTYSGTVRTRNDAPADRALLRARDFVVSNRVLEYLQSFLVPLRLPRDLTIVAAQCNGERSTYKSSSAIVTICYEQIDKILGVAESHARGNAAEVRFVVTGAMIMVILHETAIGIFDVLNIPVWGRQDDAADRLAAFIGTQFGDNLTSLTVLGMAKYLMWSRRMTIEALLQSDQSPEMQRFFEFLCIGLGSARKVVAPLIVESLPENVFALQRFRQCDYAAAQVRKAFNLRIMPYVDPQKLVRARASFN